MKELKKGRERTWYLVKEWKTKAGLDARIQKCVWSDEVKQFGPSLDDFCTGYVRVPDTDKTNYYDAQAIDIHGGVTFDGTLEGEAGRWVGFDMAHLFDEKIPDQETYAEKECESLAEQIKKLQK